MSTSCWWNWKVGQYEYSLGEEFERERAINFAVIIKFNMEHALEATSKLSLCILIHYKTAQRPLYSGMYLCVGEWHLPWLCDSLSWTLAYACKLLSAWIKGDSRSNLLNVLHVVDTNLLMITLCTRCPCNKPSHKDSWGGNHWIGVFSNPIQTFVMIRAPGWYLSILQGLVQTCSILNIT